VGEMVVELCRERRGEMIPPITDIPFAKMADALAVVLFFRSDKGSRPV